MHYEDQPAPLMPPDADIPLPEVGSLWRMTKGMSIPNACGYILQHYGPLFTVTQIEDFSGFQIHIKHCIHIWSSDQGEGLVNDNDWRISIRRGWIEEV